MQTKHKINNRRRAIDFYGKLEAELSDTDRMQKKVNEN